MQVIGKSLRKSEGTLCSRKSDWALTNTLKTAAAVTTGAGLIRLRDLFICLRSYHLCTSCHFPAVWLTDRTTSVKNMLRRTQIFRKVNPFSLFMRETKGHKLLANLPVVKRGKMLSKLYRKLSAIELVALTKRAAVTTFPRKTGKATKGKGKARKPTAYTKFFGKWSKQLTGPSRDRVKQIGRLWKKAHQVRRTLKVQKPKKFKKVQKKAKVQKKSKKVQRKSQKK